MSNSFLAILFSLYVRNTFSASSKGIFAISNSLNSYKKFRTIKNSLEQFSFMFKDIFIPEDQSNVILYDSI